MLEHTKGKSPDCPACKAATEAFHKKLDEMSTLPKMFRLYPSVGTCNFRYHMSTVSKAD